MKLFLLSTIFCFFVLSRISGQTKAELEEKRKKALAEIEYVDNLLKITAKEKGESLNSIKIIGNKLNLREFILKGLKEEISLLNERILLNTIALDIMESDLVNLRNEYEKAVINSYKLHKGNPELVYILSAKDFNQGYKRLKYLQQITKFRRRESEIILELKIQIETSKEKLQIDLNRISELKSREEQQKLFLQNEKDKKQRMVKSLNNKEKQLKKELEEKRKIANKIEKEIVKLIEEERRKLASKEEKPEQKLIGDSFAENKGKLPWPVINGVITSQFGLHKHPVLKYLEEDNIGIEITSSGKNSARSIFNGEVARVFTIPGANMTVIVKHGKYLSVYSNLVNVKVKNGDKIATRQEIGDVFEDPGAGLNCVLKFMIFEINAKYLDPEIWIAKR